MDFTRKYEYIYINIKGNRNKTCINVFRKAKPKDNNFIRKIESNTIKG